VARTSSARGILHRVNTAPQTALNGWPFVRFKARIDLLRFLMGIGYERAIEYAWIFRELQATSDQRIIDVGSASSVFPLFLHAVAGAAVDCVDFDRSVLKLTGYAEKCGLGESLRNGRLVIQQISTLPLPYPDEHFDGLSCVSTIEHSPEDSDTRSLLELMRVVKTGGRLAFSVPIATRHADVYVNSDVYDRKFGGAPVFYERHYDIKSIHERLIGPSGATLLSLEAFGEPGFEFGRRVAYHKWIGLGGLLKPLRWTMPWFAHRFIKPVPLERPPLRSFCCFVLKK
jgi:SAM-dependent methyltransferase